MDFCYLRGVRSVFLPSEEKMFCDTSLRERPGRVVDPRSLVVVVLDSTPPQVLRGRSHSPRTARGRFLSIAVHPPLWPPAQANLMTVSVISSLRILCTDFEATMRNPRFPTPPSIVRRIREVLRPVWTNTHAESPTGHKISRLYSTSSRNKTVNFSKNSRFRYFCAREGGVALLWD